MQILKKLLNLIKNKESNPEKAKKLIKNEEANPENAIKADQK